MENQGYNDRLDEHLAHRKACRHGNMHQAMKDRRDESEGMEKHYHKRKYAADPFMDRSDREIGSVEHMKKHYSKKMR